MKQNVQFQVAVCSDKIQLYQIKFGRPSAIIRVISVKPCQIARPLLQKQNVQCYVGICPAKFQLYQIQIGPLAALAARHNQEIFI